MARTEIPIEQVREILRDCIQATALMKAPEVKATNFIVKCIERELRTFEKTEPAPTNTSKEKTDDANRD